MSAAIRTRRFTHSSPVQPTPFPFICSLFIIFLEYFYYSYVDKNDTICGILSMNFYFDMFLSIKLNGLFIARLDQKLATA